MPRSPECPACRVSMLRGYMLDRSRNTRGAVIWVADEPEKAFLAGVKLKGHEQSEVAAFRCPKCKRLELFAG